MKDFDYERATDAPGALALLHQPNTKAIAGGTNLVDLMRLGVEGPAHLVDISGALSSTIEDLPDGGVRIGAMARNSDLAAHSRIRQNFPVLTQAIVNGASGQIRNMASTGGNLLQRTRCVYFTDVTVPCNKRHPGSGCPARAGEHRNLAILGASTDCIATHSSDMAVALQVLDANVGIMTAGGTRSVPVDEFFRLPGSAPELDTNLAPGELITHLDIAALPAGTVSSYRKVRDRASYAFALVSIAAALSVAPDGTVSAVRLAFGGVAHKPWRAHAAERELVGRPATVESFAAAADAELAAAEPLPDNGFKLTLTRRLVVSALTGLTSAASRTAVTR